MWNLRLQCDDRECSVMGTAKTGAQPAAESGPGAAVTARAVVEVLENLLAANDRVARHNREHFDAHGVLVINLMSSPGAGKTALLEATIAALRSRYRIAVIEGDLETDQDAARIRAQGVPAVQITTGTPVTWMPSSCIGRCMSCRWPASTCCSSRTWAISSVQRASISVSTGTSPCSASPRATTSRRSTR